LRETSFQKLPASLQITIFGEEPPVYDRVHPVNIFRENGWIFSWHPDWYSERAWPHLGIPFSIDRTANRPEFLRVLPSIRYSWSWPPVRQPWFPIHGIEKGVFVYRSIEDLDLIRDHAKNAKSRCNWWRLLGLRSWKAMMTWV
jgi:nitrite reductase (NADH) large subunit